MEPSSSSINKHSRPAVALAIPPSRSHVTAHTTLDSVFPRALQPILWTYWPRVRPLPRTRASISSINMYALLSVPTDF